MEATIAEGTTDTVVGKGECGDPLGAAGAKNLFDDVIGYRCLLAVDDG